MLMLESTLYMQLRPEFVENPDFNILKQLGALCGHFNKGYCYPSQETLLKRLQTHGDRVRPMSRRTLNRHLNTFEVLGYIERVRRHRHDPGKGMQFHSTLYKLTKLCWAYLKRGMAVLEACFRSVISRVPFPAQHTSQKKFRPGAATQKPGGPPPGNDKNVRADDGAGWNKKKAVAKLHLANIRSLLAQSPRRQAYQK